MHLLYPLYFPRLNIIKTRWVVHVLLGEVTYNDEMR